MNRSIFTKGDRFFYQFYESMEPGRAMLKITGNLSSANFKKLHFIKNINNFFYTDKHYNWTLH